MEYIVKGNYIKQFSFMIVGFLFAKILQYIVRDFPVPEFKKFIIGFILLAIILAVILLFKNKKLK